MKPSQWILGCVIVGALLLMLVVIGVLCVGVGSLGLKQVAGSLPTPRPRPTLIVGNTYWIGALVPPAGLSRPTIRWVAIYNKPGAPGSPGVTTVAWLNDADGTPVRLAGIRDKWCYIEATREYRGPVEGWMECHQLLDYESSRRFLGDGASHLQRFPPRVPHIA